VILGYYYGNIYDKMCLGNILLTGTMFCRKQILSEYVFNKDMRVLNDYELAARISKRFDAAYMNIPTQLHRQHEAQLTRNTLWALEAGIRIVENIWKKDKEFYLSHKKIVDKVLQKNTGQWVIIF